LLIYPCLEAEEIKKRKKIIRSKEKRERKKGKSGENWIK
jgi:hypothetical protein